jgi:hypothetical protein
VGLFDEFVKVSIGVFGKGCILQDYGSCQSTCDCPEEREYLVDFCDLVWDEIDFCPFLSVRLWVKFLVPVGSDEYDLRCKIF